MEFTDISILNLPVFNRGFVFNKDVLLLFPSNQGEISWSGNERGYHTQDSAPKAAQAVRVQPIEVPSIPLDELRDVTENFGPRTLIGEGSYGRVYHGVLKNGRATAVKKLDDNKQPDHEFLAQVRNFYLILILMPIRFILHVPFPWRCDHNKAFCRCPWFQGWNMKMWSSCLVITLMGMYVFLHLSLQPTGPFMIFSTVRDWHYSPHIIMNHSNSNVWSLSILNPLKAVFFFFFVNVRVSSITWYSSSIVGVPCLLSFALLIAKIWHQNF